MIEPAAYGVPCVFGPHVWNFKDAARRLVEVGGAVMVSDASTLELELSKLLGDMHLRERMSHAARDLVNCQQGATERTLALVEEAMKKLRPTRIAACAAASNHEKRRKTSIVGPHPKSCPTVVER